MDALYRRLAKGLAAIILLMAMPKLAGRLSYALGGHRIVVDDLVLGLGGLAAAGLLARVAFGPAGGPSLWMRLAGVAVFNYCGVSLLAAGFEGFRPPNDFTYWPPLVLVAAVLLGWGSFTAVGGMDEGGARLRRWMMQVLLGAIGACVVIDLGHRTFGGVAPFTLLQLVPHLALAGAIVWQRHDEAALPVLLLRWAAGYLLMLVAAVALDEAGDAFTDPGLFLEGLPWGVFLVGVAVVAVRTAWRVWTDRDWRRHLAVFGVAGPRG